MIAAEILKELESDLKAELVYCGMGDIATWQVIANDILFRARWVSSGVTYAYDFKLYIEEHVIFNPTPIGRPIAISHEGNCYIRYHLRRASIMMRTTVRGRSTAPNPGKTQPPR